MLVSFTQTYGSGRDELFHIYFRDKRLIELKNLCDLNIYSFHNCEQSTIDKFKELSNGSVKNLVILEYNDMSYTETIRRSKEYLKEVGCTHLFFSQDDTFIAIENKDIDWKELVDYVKTHESGFMLNLYNRIDVLMLDGEVWKGEVDKQNTFNVYKSTTKDFYESDKTPWPMDDSPYMCTIDLIDEIYDDEYFKHENIWDAEKYLKFKYSEREIDRYVTDKKMLQNYNLYGITTYMDIVFRKILIQNGLL